MTRAEDEARIVDQLACEMHLKLRVRRARGAWDTMTPDDLLYAAMGETGELDDALVAYMAAPSARTRGDVLSECADVANYLAMLVDCVTRRRV